MASESLPINPARFAEALKELPASSLALKVFELRNSIAHLDYSNAELKPYAEGRASTLDRPGGAAAQPDQDCIDAIAENEVVIARMQQRIELIRAEIESRGLSWREFQSKEEEEAENATATVDAGTQARTADSTTLTNGVNGHGSEAASGSQHEAWRDGTFQTGTLRAGMTDEELLRQLQSRMPPEDDDESDGGMHL